MTFNSLDGAPCEHPAYAECGACAPCLYKANRYLKQEIQDLTARLSAAWNINHECLEDLDWALDNSKLFKATKLTGPSKAARAKAVRQARTNKIRLDETETKADVAVNRRREAIREQQAKGQ